VPGQDIIRVEGRIVEKLRDRLFRAELVNGHRVVAHPTRTTRSLVSGLDVGSQVQLELSPFDMSTGRIVAVGA
jgi:translation initiation factor IF-1